MRHYLRIALFLAVCAALASLRMRPLPVNEMVTMIHKQPSYDVVALSTIVDHKKNHTSSLDYFERLKELPPSLHNNNKMSSIQLSPCRVALQESLRPWQAHWFEHQQPMLQALWTTTTNIYGTNTTTTKLVYQILFITKRSWSQGLDGERYQHYRTARWLCNDQTTTTTVAPLVCRHRHTLIVTCPTSSFQRPLETVTVTTPDNATIIYNVSALVHCQDEIAIREQRPALLDNNNLDNNNNLTLAACTSIRGAHDRDLLLQWVEYHRLIGMQHFWIYLNEPLANYMTTTTSVAANTKTNTSTANPLQWSLHLPQRPYITYIPYDYSLPQQPPGNFFYQQAAQNECLHRSRAQGIQWLGLHDVDEYLHVTMTLNATTTTTTTNNNQPATLVDLLASLPNRGDAYGALVFRNWYYGRAPSQWGRLGRLFGRRRPKPLPLLLDYTSKSRTALPAHQREKLLVNTAAVQMVSVHKITGGTVEAYLLNPNTQGYHQHYKLADHGVYQSRPRDTVVDETLARKFRPALSQALGLGDEHDDDPHQDDDWATRTSLWIFLLVIVVTVVLKRGWQHFVFWTRRRKREL